MYFTLAVSAPDPATCAELTQRACGTDPRVMPIPGPARVIWRAPGGHAALIIWGDGPAGPGHMRGDSPAGPGHMRGDSPAGPGHAGGPGSAGPGHMRGDSPAGPGYAGGPPPSYAGTIWVAGDGGGTVFARTAITRVDPVFVTRAGRAAIIADRASWAAATAAGSATPTRCCTPGCSARDTRSARSPPSPASARSGPRRPAAPPAARSPRPTTPR